jgi:hypothetical protein
VLSHAVLSHAVPCAMLQQVCCCAIRQSALSLPRNDVCLLCMSTLAGIVTLSWDVLCCTDYAELTTEIRTSVPGAVTCLAMFEDGVLCAVLSGAVPCHAQIMPR